jgi:DNA repair protein NreA
MCATCKGKGMCGLPHCPVMKRFQAQVRTVQVKEFMGSSPSLFIGSYGYPKVTGGPLLINDADNPPSWVASGLGIEDIVDIRARTIRGTSQVAPYLPALQELAVSSVPLDVEARFNRPVSFDLTFDGTIAPVGLSGSLENLKVIDNPKIAPPVDRVTSDTDLGVAEACSELHRSGIDVYRISHLMSGGLIGRRRKVVPTRWSITAVDDSVSSALKHKIVRYTPFDHIHVFSHDLYANRIVVIMLPGDWRYEMIERWEAQSLWAGDSDSITADREGLKKTGYSPIGGAYYSARLAVAEYLDAIRHCARIIVIRSVSADYWAPLGTWVIREATRGAMKQPGIACENVDEAVRVAGILSGFKGWEGYSSLLPEIRTQRTLSDFRP